MKYSTGLPIHSQLKCISSLEQKDPNRHSDFTPGLHAPDIQPWTPRKDKNTWAWFGKLVEDRCAPRLGAARYRHMRVCPLDLVLSSPIMSEVWIMRLVLETVHYLWASVISAVFSQKVTVTPIKLRNTCSKQLPPSNKSP